MGFRLPGLKREKRFRLFVADVPDAPADTWHGSLKAAVRAFDKLDPDWKDHAWIIEYGEQPRFGGIPVVRDVVHLRNGELTGERSPAAPES
jgi:hypothetical protein